VQELVEACREHGGELVLSKIEQRGERFGILLAMNGITGDAADLTEAHKIVANFLPKRIRMIVITKDEFWGSGPVNSLSR
jgi:glycine cleavage system regulatory protein